MQNQEITKKVENLILEVLNIESLPLKASAENVEQWDSLAYLSIVSKLEKEFKLKISQENINKFNSLENIVKEIEVCTKKKTLADYFSSHASKVKFIYELETGKKKNIHQYLVALDKYLLLNK